MRSRHACRRPISQTKGIAMTIANASVQGSSAGGIAWDLRDLYVQIDDPAIHRDLATALLRAQAFDTAYRGKIGVDEGPTTAIFSTALQELESLSELMDKPVIFASLVHASKTDNPRHGALLSAT